MNIALGDTRVQASILGLDIVEGIAESLWAASSAQKNNDSDLIYSHDDSTDGLTYLSATNVASVGS